MPGHTITLHRVLRAPAERIDRAFLDVDALAKWLPPHGFTAKPVYFTRDPPEWAVMRRADKA